MTLALLLALLLQDAAAEVQAGHADWDAGDIKAAVEHFDKAIALSKARSVDALIGRGRCRLKLGQKTPALRDFEAAMAEDPASIEAVAFRGMYHLLANEDVSAAKADLKAALGMKGTSDVTKWLEARILAAEGKTDEAYSLYNRIPSGRRGWSDCYLEFVFLGRGGAVKNRNPNTEVRFLDNLTEWRPREPLYYLWRGEAKFGTGLKSLTAESDFTKYLEMKPADPVPGHRGRALARIAGFTPNKPGAIEDATVVLAANPKDLEMLLLRGTEADVMLAVEISPKHTAVRCLHARLLEKKGDAAEAVAILVELAKAVPTKELPADLRSLPSNLQTHLDVSSNLHWRLRVDAMRLLIGLGRPAEAIPLGRELLKARADDRTGILRLAEALEASGDAEGAAKTWEEASKHPKIVADAHFRGQRAGWHYRSGRRAEAMADYEVAAGGYGSSGADACLEWALLLLQERGRDALAPAEAALNRILGGSYPPPRSYQDIFDHVIGPSGDVARMLRNIEQAQKLEIEELESRLEKAPEQDKAKLAEQVKSRRASLDAVIQSMHSTAMYVAGRRCLIEGKTDDAKAWFEKSTKPEAKFELKKLAEKK